MGFVASTVDNHLSIHTKLYRLLPFDKASFLYFKARAFRLWSCLTVVIMEELYEKVDALGEKLLNWADPENQFRGYTEVRVESLLDPLWPTMSDRKERFFCLHRKRLFSYLTWPLCHCFVFSDVAGMALH